MYEALMARTVIDPTTGCWNWTGPRIPKGYGYMTVDYVKNYIHRLAWQTYNGPIPTGKHVCHTCDNPPCWNPAHLWLGTNMDNRRDSVEKRRWSHGDTKLNGERNRQAKLTEPEVTEMRALYVSGVSMADLARKYGRNSSTIEHVIWRHSWKHLP